MAFFERKSRATGDVVPLHELKTQRDVAHELGLYNRKNITKEQSDILFRRVGIAINTMPVEDDVATVINLNIDDVKFHVTLQPTGEKLSLSVTQTTKDP